jgi:hypothetical protein
MLLHEIFNFSLEVFEVFGLLLILLVIIPFGWWMTCRNIRCAHADPASVCSAQEREAVIAETATPVSEHRFCTSCGAPVRPGMRFCENCGKTM